LQKDKLKKVAEMCVGGVKFEHVIRMRVAIMVN
jgi:hypothetical protein